MMGWTARRVAGGAATAGVAAATVLALAAPASAHVTVNPGEAEAGGYARLDFRVPNESDTESTVAVEIHFPEETPVPSVSVAPVPGWQTEVTDRTLDEPIEGGHGAVVEEVVETITWTAESQDAWIGPGEFQEFPVSIGPVPETDTLYFRALQTYSDDEVVRWIDTPAEGVEADRPAPALQVTAGDGGHGDGTTGDQGDADGQDPAGEAAAGDTAGDTDSGADAFTLALAVFAAVVSLIALGLVGQLFLRGRRER